MICARTAMLGATDDHGVFGFGRGGEELPAEGLPSPLLSWACHWSDTYHCLAHLQAIL